MKLRLSQPERPGRSRRDRRAQAASSVDGDGVVDRRDGARTPRSRRPPTVKRAHPGARRARRRHRRPAGAQHGHDRRLDRQRRSGGRLPGGACWRSARRSHTDQRTIAADDFFKGLFETALAPGEIITAVAFPVPQRAAYVKFPQSGVALRAGRRVRRADARRRRARRRHRRGATRVPRDRDREGARAELHAGGRAKASKIDAGGPQQRPARLGRIPRASDRRDGVARGRGGAGARGSRLREPDRGADACRPAARP